MPRIVAIAAAQYYRAGKPGWRNFRCEPLPSGTWTNPDFVKSETNWRIFRGICRLLDTIPATIRQLTPSIGSALI
jgi:hypothetical protein